MTDPFEDLRIPPSPVDPDPDFARALRARVERALLGSDDVDSVRMLSTPSGPPPGHISYAELATPDVALAARFYARVLGWRTSPSQDRDGSEVRQVEERAIGLRGVDRAPTLVPYYVVPDLDAAVALVRAAGGTAGEPAGRSYGRTLDCVDDQGLPFTLVARATGGSNAFRRTSGHGDLDYVLLRVPDATRARAFYGTVLGWRFRPGAGPGYWHPDPGGHPSAVGSGLEGGHAEAIAVPWFGVPDLGAALAAVHAAGGRRAGPVRHQRGGPRVECTDDQGARFGLAQA